jgi:NhaP-type Na+/H+ or K+/H+ antiporter
MNEQIKLIKIMTDFRHYSTVLIALSVFLYIGILIKGTIHTEQHLLWILIAAFFLLFCAFLCLYISAEIKDKITDMEEENM